MASSDQMTRDELLKARDRVQEQLRILQSRTVGFPSAGFVYKNRDDLVSELTQILDEIQFELGKLDA
jgi:hypothetical protein